jgi:hypothetical protein
VRQRTYPRRRHGAFIALYAIYCVESAVATVSSGSSTIDSFALLPVIEQFLRQRLPSVTCFKLRTV